MSRRRLIAAAGALGLAGVLAGCQTKPGEATPSTSSAPTGTDTLVLGVPTPNSQTPDPFITTAVNYTLLWSTTEPLVRRELDGTLTPCLATDWKYSGDGLTWTFTLRGGVKMQDGSTLTARDVKTAVDRAVSAPPALAVHFAQLKAALANVNVLDDLHVSITTKKPYATLLDDLPPPVPTDYYTRIGEDQFRKQPRGAGAFTLVKQEIDRSMSLARFDDFWDKTRFPNFKKLEVMLIADESTRAAGLQSGSLDAIQGLSAVTARQLETVKGIRVVRTAETSLATMFFEDLWFTDKVYPLQDVRVRQALLYALDREAMSKALYDGFATVPANVLIASTLGFHPAQKPYPYDPAKAKQLLQAAGQAGMTLPFNSRNQDDAIPDVQKLSQAIAANWQAVGIKVEYSTSEGQNQQTDHRARKLHGARLTGYTSSLLYEPTRFAESTLLSTSANANLHDPKLDAYILKMGSSIDSAARSQVAMEYGSYVYDTLPAFPVLGIPTGVALGPRVREWKLQRSNPFAGPFWYLSAN